jgi:hypothetical protein
MRTRFQIQTIMAALAIVGSTSVYCTAAPKSNAKSSTSPQLVGKTLTITCKVTPKSATGNGVIVAQGGSQRGYVLYLKAGKPIFSVRQQGKLYTAKSSATPKGSFTLEAHLRKDGAMTLAVGSAIVARAKAPGLFAVQPKDPLSTGQDTLSAVGDYKAPYPFAGKVQNVKVSAQ